MWVDEGGKWVTHEVKNSKSSALKKRGGGNVSWEKRKCCGG